MKRHMRHSKAGSFGLEVDGVLVLQAIAAQMDEETIVSADIGDHR